MRKFLLSTCKKIFELKSQKQMGLNNVNISSMFKDGKGHAKTEVVLAVTD